VAVLRLQSGLPAVGEAHFNLGGDFHFVVGGPDGGYHVGVMPVTLEEARSGGYGEGTARVAAYCYQSYDDGRVPPAHDVVDVFGQDRAQTAWLQREALASIRLMTGHGEFQPYLTAEEAERRALELSEALKDRFTPVPQSGTGEGDPLVDTVNQRSGGETVSDIKADGGGKVGHTTSPTLFSAVARSSLEEARETGLIGDFTVFGIGDDLHLLMRHNRGIDANDVHLLAFRTFWRMVWVTELIGYKPYSLAQDLQIGPATKGKKVDDLAAPTASFVEMLDQTLPEPERSFLPGIRQAAREWKRGRGTVEVKKPFAGNVTGQGPGFAELPFRGPGRIGLLAADKAGPACFNIPVYHAVTKALEKGEFAKRRSSGIAFEIWDVHRHTRIFLDARAEADEAGRLLGATNLFNIKRLWSLDGPPAAGRPVTESLKEIVLAASTERLALITGGQYVGKDDPVLLGVDELMEPLFEHVKGHTFMTQGDERGSHYMVLVPKPLPEAVATIRSRGFWTGLYIPVVATGIGEVHDVFAGPDFKEARIRADKANARLWRAQGSEFTPIGVGARDVEPAYPLMKVLNRLTAKGSPYGVQVTSATARLYEAIASGEGN
jgi:fructose 1,6-bisphosphate aldolase/phosphatase